MEIKLDRPIVFLDLETTGIDTLSDRIVEFHGVKINPDGTEEVMNTRINPEVTISPEAIAIHGITNEDVIDKLTFKDCADRIKDFLFNCDLGGFNIKRFDLEILEAEFKRAEIEFSRDERYIIDVQTIYHKFEPRDLSAAYKKYLGGKFENHHSAEGDVKATIDVFKSQIKVHSELPKSINELHNFCNERTSPNWIDSKGKFIWIGSDASMNFSKYKGKSLKYMVENESGFLDWILKGNFPDDVKKIVSNALNDIFPEKV